MAKLWRSACGVASPGRSGALRPAPHAPPHVARREPPAAAAEEQRLLAARPCRRRRAPGGRGPGSRASAAIAGSPAGTTRVFRPLPSTRSCSPSWSTSREPQRDQLLRAQPAGVRELEHRAVAQLQRRGGGDRVEQPRGFVRAQHAAAAASRGAASRPGRRGSARSGRARAGWRTARAARPACARRCSAPPRVAEQARHSGARRGASTLSRREPRSLAQAANRSSRCDRRGACAAPRRAASGPPRAASSAAAMGSGSVCSSACRLATCGAASGADTYRASIRRAGAGACPPAGAPVSRPKPECTCTRRPLFPARLDSRQMVVHPFSPRAPGVRTGRPPARGWLDRRLARPPALARRRRAPRQHDRARLRRSRRLVFVHGLSGSWPNWLEQLLRVLGDPIASSPSTCRASATRRATPAKSRCPATRASCRRASRRARDRRRRRARRQLDGRLRSAPSSRSPVARSASSASCSSPPRALPPTRTAWRRARCRRVRRARAACWRSAPGSPRTRTRWSRGARSAPGDARRRRPPPRPLPAPLAAEQLRGAGKPTASCGARGDPRARLATACARSPARR